MQQQRFSFETPLNGYDKIRIEGVIYKDEAKGFDIDEVIFNGTNILPVLHWLGDGSVNELDKVYNVTEQHCIYLRETWSEQTDLTTDIKQQAA